MSDFTQLGFVKQTDGENVGTWGEVLNDSLIDLLDDAIGGYVEVSVASGNVTLAFADGTAGNNGRHAVIKFTGSPGTTRTVTFPNKQKTYYINNGSDSSVICTAGTGAQTVTVATGLKDIIYIDGSDEIHSILQDGAVSEKIISSQTAISSGIDTSNDQLLLRDNSATALKKVSIASIFSSVGGLTDLSGDSSPQLGGNLDMNGNDIVTTSNANIDLLPNGTGKVIMDGNGSSGGISVSDGLIDIRTGTGNVAKVKFYCESSNAHAQTLQAAPHSAGSSAVLVLPTASGNLVGTGDSGTVTNAMLAGSIADSKLSTISTAGKVDIGALEIDGATDIGADLADADLFIVDDGGGGTERKTAASRILTYVQQAGTFPLTGLDIDGGTDIGAALADADLIIVDDGAGGTNRKATLTRLKTYLTSAGFSTEDPTALAIALG
jgi:hypothetical protein|tara:strand:- start:26 stop:1336 length:1311 start_codon:yes stop_codon:yes gene_type:complete